MERGENSRMGEWLEGEGGQISVGCQGEVLYRESGEVLEQLPTEAVDPRPSLEVFKARLDGALGSLGCCEMWRLVALRVAGGWRFVILEVPSNPGHSVILCAVVGAFLKVRAVAACVEKQDLCRAF